MKNINTTKFWAWYFNTDDPLNNISALYLRCSGFGDDFNFDSLEVELTESDGTMVDYSVRNTIALFGLINAMCFLGNEYNAKVLVGKFGEDVRCIMTCANDRKLSFCLPLHDKDWDALRPE